MRHISIFAAATLLATAGAMAQNAPSSTAPGSSPSTQGMAPAAPTGHRQPKLNDLPPDVADRQKSDAQPDSQPPSEKALRAVEGDLDKRLRICSRC